MAQVIIGRSTRIEGRAEGFWFVGLSFWDDTQLGSRGIALVVMRGEDNEAEVTTHGACLQLYLLFCRRVLKGARGYGSSPDIRAVADIELILGNTSIGHILATLIDEVRDAVVAAHIHDDLVRTRRSDWVVLGMPDGATTLVNDVLDGFTTSLFAAYAGDLPFALVHIVRYCLLVGGTVAETLSRSTGTHETSLNKGKGLGVDLFLAAVDAVVNGGIRVGTGERDHSLFGADTNRWTDGRSHTCTFCQLGIGQLFCQRDEEEVEEGLLGAYAVLVEDIRATAGVAESAVVGVDIQDSRLAEGHLVGMFLAVATAGVDILRTPMTGTGSNPVGSHYEQSPTLFVCQRHPAHLFLIALFLRQDVVSPFVADKAMMKSHEGCLLAVAVAVLRSTTQPGHVLRSFHQFRAQPHSRQFGTLALGVDGCADDDGTICQDAEVLLHGEAVFARGCVGVGDRDSNALTAFFLSHLQLSGGELQAANAHIVVGSCTATLVVCGQTEHLQGERRSYQLLTLESIAGQLSLTEGDAEVSTRNGDGGSTLGDLQGVTLDSSVRLA